MQVSNVIHDNHNSDTTGGGVLTHANASKALRSAELLHISGKQFHIFTTEDESVLVKLRSFFPRFQGVSPDLEAPAIWAMSLH